MLTCVCVRHWCWSKFEFESNCWCLLCLFVFLTTERRKYTTRIIIFWCFFVFTPKNLPNTCKLCRGSSRTLSPVWWCSLLCGAILLFVLRRARRLEAPLYPIVAPTHGITDPHALQQNIGTLAVHTASVLTPPIGLHPVWGGSWHAMITSACSVNVSGKILL